MTPLAFDPSGKFAKIEPEAKIIWVIGFAIAILAVNSSWSQLAMLLVLVLFAIYGGSSLRQMIDYFKIFIPILLIIFGLHLFYHSGEVLFRIWILRATRAGLRAGVFNTIRFINFMLLAACFFKWTSPVALAKRLASGFGLVRSQRLQEIGLVFFIAMRFVPVLIRERSLLALAMMARGSDLRAGVRRRIAANIKMTLPLFSRVIGQTEDVAVALALKSSGGTFFNRRARPLSSHDFLFAATGLALAAAVIFLV